MIEFLNPEGWARPKGYSNVVTGRGRQVYVAGQIGWNEKEQFETEVFAGQVRQALANIKTCLAAADAEPHHLVRLTWYVTDKQEYLENLADIGAAYRETLGRVFPAMALVQVVALVEDEAKVEIEATALVPDDD